MGFWDINVADAVQIAFWLLVGTLTLLTFLQARKTIFQPIKLEVFKLQLVSLTRLSDALYGKGEWELVEEFALDEVFADNAWNMVGDYAGYVLRMRSPELDAAAESEPDLRYASPTWQPLGERSELPVLSVGEWVKGAGEPIRLSNKHWDSVHRLQVLGADPLLPASISTAVESLLDAIEDNIAAIGSVLRASASDFAIRHPYVESLSGASIGWIHNRWNGERATLEEKARAVLLNIREYYRPDEIGFVKMDVGERRRRAKA